MFWQKKRPQLSVISRFYFSFWAVSAKKRHGGTDGTRAGSG
jgi:hypothetical protein